MTDYFALLGLPQSAALDEAVLQAAWHEKSRAAHPDQPGGDAKLAAEINAAFEVLSAPEKRLKHLLDLHEVPWRAIPISNELMGIFAELGPQLQQAAALGKEKAQASSALVRALLMSKEMPVRERLEELGLEVERLRVAILDRLPAVGADFTKLQTAQAELAYLSKWQAQIREALLVMMV